MDYLFFKMIKLCNINRHCMKKEFKEDNMILLEYRTKYYFISCVLDILEEKKNLFKQDEVDAQDVFSIFQQRF